MITEKLRALYVKYGLERDDVFKHQHYVIITRQGIDKIQAKGLLCSLTGPPDQLQPQ